ncbi:MAG TPA: serine hydrolase [Desulfopila sp.]|nr:serine hydrolase [Desulfopila sp.]
MYIPFTVRILTTLVLLSSTMLLADWASARPAPKEIGKEPAAIAPSPTTLAPRVLGKYRDFSRYKKAAPDYALSTAQSRVLRTLSAQSAIIIDGASRETLFAKNPHSPRQPASTIKVLTGMIALKALGQDDTVAVSPKAARQPRSKVYLDHRKHYPVHDLINAVLLSSANDASVALAEKIAGSESTFAKIMTLRARLWGARETVCKTATGLTANGQQSTASDLALIFKHAMDDKEFARRMKHTKARTVEGKVLRNHNKALWQIEGAEGGKTGYTSAARQTYVGKFKRGEDEIIIALMGSERMWSDLKELVEYGFLKKQILATEKSTENVLVADTAE